MDDHLRSLMPNASHEWIRKRIAAGCCLVDGVARPSGYVLDPGTRVSWTANGPVPEIVPESLPLRVIFEDDLLIAVDKPAGMLSHPTSRVRTGTVLNGLCGLLQSSRPHLPHRLDRETSGVLLALKRIVKGQRAGRWFEERLVEKQYLAVVTGNPGWDDLTVTAPIGRDPAAIPKWKVLAGGAPAETRFRVLKRGTTSALVEAIPVTGRTNQIRIHAAAAGYPIKGDSTYHGVLADRLYLHAWTITLPYPAATARTTILAPLPQGFAELTIPR